MNTWMRTVALAAGIAVPAFSPGALNLAIAPAKAQIKPTTVRIVAERFRFTPDEVRVKRGTEIQFRLESDDTDHGFRIVGTDINTLISKRGRGVTTVSFTAEKSGRYTFECAKVCGAGHEFMRGVLIVED